MTKFSKPEPRGHAVGSGVSQLSLPQLQKIAKKIEERDRMKKRNAQRCIKKDQKDGANLLRYIRRVCRGERREGKPSTYVQVQNLDVRTFYYQHLHWTYDKKGKLRHVPSSKIVYPDLRVKPYHDTVGYVPAGVGLCVSSGYGARKKGEKYPNITNAKTYYCVAEEGWMWVLREDFEGYNARNDTPNRQ